MGIWVVFGGRAGWGFAYPGWGLCFGFVFVVFVCVCVYFVWVACWDVSVVVFGGWLFVIFVCCVVVGVLACFVRLFSFSDSVVCCGWVCFVCFTLLV